MEEYIYKYDPVPGLVSVIIPTHNRANLITETLNSFENQLYDNIELIIVDDHSTDNTKEIVEEISKRSRFEIYYIPSDGNGGCHARNIGLINSRGEYIQFFDDDDLVNPDFFTKRVESLLKGYDFATCNFSYFKGDPTNIVGMKRIDNIPHTVDSHLKTGSLPTPCFLFKRTALKKIRFWNESIKRLQDMAYYHRLFMYGLTGDWRNECLFNVRQHDKNISQRVSFEGMIYAYSMIENEWKGKKDYWQVAKVCTIAMLSILYHNKTRCLTKEWIYSVFYVLNKVLLIIF